MFDPTKFMNLQVDQPMDTEYVPIPEGEWTASIKDVKPRMAKESAILDVLWRIDDPSGQVKASTGLDENIVRQSIFLDVTPAGGFDLGKGKNVQLGKVRDAVGQNVPGQPWAPSNLKGAAARIKTGQRMADDGSGRIYSDVKAVTKLG